MSSSLSFARSGAPAPAPVPSSSAPVNSSSRPNFAASNTFRPSRPFQSSQSRGNYSKSGSNAPNSKAPSASSATGPSPFAAPPSASPPSRPRGVITSFTRSAQDNGISKTVMRIRLEGSTEEKEIVDDGEGGIRIIGELAVGDQVELNQAGSMSEWAKYVPAKAATIKKKRKVFTLDHLVGEDGLRKLLNEFPKYQPRGAGYESRDLHDLMGLYKRWAYEMWPKASLNVLSKRFCSFGSQGRLRVLLDEIRANMGENIDWDNFKLELDDDQREKTNTAKEGQKAEQEEEEEFVVNGGAEDGDEGDQYF